MSVIVRMEMPTGCENCPMADDDSRFCKAAKEYIPMLGKPSWCPIVGVLPEQHGRLVDADACSSVLRKLENEAETYTEKLCYGYAARMFEEAFTIIAAERKDDGNDSE